MEDNNYPSQDPSQPTNMGEALRGILDKYMQQVDIMLPATVVSYSPTTMMATVRPSIDMVTTNGERLGRAPLANIKVLQIGAGGFVLNYTVKPGDTGWIEASDRDISTWLQDGTKSNTSSPNTKRIHSFSDGRFVPDRFRTFVRAAAVDGVEHAVLQHENGTNYIAVTPYAAWVIGQNAIHINASGPTARVNINAVGGVWVNGIRIDTHSHGGVETGSGNTGGPHN